jgi:hypothetical protein
VIIKLGLPKMSYRPRHATAPERELARGIHQRGSPLLTVALFWLVFAVAGHSIPARGQVTTLQTGVGQPLQTASLPLTIPTPSLQPILLFNFGFSTDETISSGSFSDSLTFTLQSADGLTTALILTADLTGVNWAPSNPGGVLINPDGIGRTPIAIPVFAQGFSTRFAWSVSFPVPSGFTGGPATLYLDLFDNQNALNSLGWADNIAIVPEPGVLVLGFWGLALLFGWRKRRA